MQKNLESIRTSISPLKKQLIKFTLIGVLAVMVDLTCYYILLNIFPENWTFGFHIEDFAKAISFLCGMSVTYIRSISFGPGRVKIAQIRGF